MNEADHNSSLTDATLGDLCAAISIGGTMRKFCEDAHLNYRLVNRWVNDDADRQKRYKLALSIREDHAKDLIISELTAYLKADVTSCFDGDGNLKRMPDMGENEKRLIAGVKFRELFEWQGERGNKTQVHIGNIIEVKFWDKPRSIETFMKHLQMLVERSDLNVKFSLADLVAGDVPQGGKDGSQTETRRSAPDHSAADRDKL